MKQATKRELSWSILVVSFACGWWHWPGTALFVAAVGMYLAGKKPDDVVAKP